MIHVTTLSRFHVLVLLKTRPYHGYELMKSLGKSLGKKISPAEIYPYLKSLKKSGLVEIKAGGARNKKSYVLTNEGKKQVAALLARLDIFMTQLIAPQLTECIHCQCNVFGKAHVEKIRGRNVAFCCINCARDYKRSTTHD